MISELKERPFWEVLTWERVKTFIVPGMLWAYVLSVVLAQAFWGQVDFSSVEHAVSSLHVNGAGVQRLIGSPK